MYQLTFGTYTAADNIGRTRITFGRARPVYGWASRTKRQDIEPKSWKADQIADEFLGEAFREAARKLSIPEGIERKDHQSGSLRRSG